MEKLLYMVNLLSNYTLLREASIQKTECMASPCFQQKKPKLLKNTPHGKIRPALTAGTDVSRRAPISRSGGMLFSGLGANLLLYQR